MGVLEKEIEIISDRGFVSFSIVYIELDGFVRVVDGLGLVFVIGKKING